MIFHMLINILLLQFLTIEGLKHWEYGPCKFVESTGLGITETHVRCSAKNISESGITVPRIPKLLPRSLRTSIKTLEFEDFTYRILENDSFIEYNNLTVLIFNHNSLETIEPHAFRNLFKLKILNLNVNKISSLPDGVFNNLPRTSYIDLRHNNIIHLQKKLFSNLLNLRSIDLSNNLIELIEEWCFFNSPNLKSVDLSNNKLIDIYPNITDNINSLTFTLYQNPWHCNAKLCPTIDSLKTIVSPTCDTPMNMKNRTWKALREIFNQNISNKQDKKQIRLQCEAFLNDTEPTTTVRGDVNNKDSNTNKNSKILIHPEGKVDSESYLASNSLYLCILIAASIILIIIVISVIWLRIRAKHATYKQHEIISFGLLSGEDPVPFPPPERGNGMNGYIALNRTNGNNFTQTSANRRTSNKRISGNNGRNNRATNVYDSRGNSEKLEMTNLPQAIEE